MLSETLFLFIHRSSLSFSTGVSLTLKLSSALVVSMRFLCWFFLTIAFISWGLMFLSSFHLLIRVRYCRNLLRSIVRAFNERFRSSIKHGESLTRRTTRIPFPSLPSPPGAAASDRYEALLSGLYEAPSPRHVESVLFFSSCLLVALPKN